MTLFPILVCSEHDAFRALRENPTWALLSIRDDGRAPFDFTRPTHDVGAPIPHTGPRLDLCFDDWPHRDGKGHWSPPEQEHAQKIVGFAMGLLDQPPAGCLIHCAAGISRSSAATLGVLAVLDPMGDPVAGLELVRRVTLARGFRDTTPVRPNPRLVALLDLALGRRWSLLTPVFEHYWAHRSGGSRDLEFHRVDAQS